MITSTELINITSALIAFHKEVGRISKDTINPFFGKKYASLSNILDVLNEPLTKNGLVVVQFPHGTNQLTIRLLHVSGEWMEDTFDISPIPEYVKEKDSDGNVMWRASQPHSTPQNLGSAITYGRRYAIGAMLSLNIDEDDDGNASSGRIIQQKKVTPLANKITNSLASKTIIQNPEPDNDKKNGIVQKPWLNEGTKEFAGAVGKLSAGTTSIEKIELVFKLSRPIKEALRKIVENAKFETATQ